MKAFILALFLGLSATIVGAEGGASAKGTPAKESTRPSARAPKPAPQVDAILGEIADRLWARGDYYWHEGRYEERIALDRTIIRMQPQFVEAYGTAGWLLDSLGRDDEALAMYRQGVAAAPGRWETHQDLGMYYYQHKDYQAAAAAFRRGTQQPGAAPYVWKMLGHASERSGQLEQALAAWEGAARVAPDDPAVGVNLERVRTRLRSQPLQ